MKVRLNSLNDGKQIISAALSAGDLSITEPELESPVTVTLKIDKGASEIKIDGVVKTTVKLVCDRCLTSFSRAINGTFSVIASFTHPELKVDDENMILIPPKANEINLNEHVHDTILLAIPMKILCREDCRGLCPTCGVNLNQTDCQCDIAEPDARWEPLKKLTLNVTEEK
ncbi:MAG: DUF177 domain-containing protein [Candidatus Neomarinimicrobiota bacterium]